MPCFYSRLGTIVDISPDDVPQADRNYRMNFVRDPETHKIIDWVGHNEPGFDSNDLFPNGYYFDLKRDPTGHTLHENFKVRCRKCNGCLQDEAREWSLRCLLESYNWSENYFITLTYADEHLVYGWYNQGILVKRHLQDFMKCLRRRVEYYTGCDGVRFFACGEYGEKFRRPHYHLLLFNCPLAAMSPLHVHSINKRGDVLYRSDEIEACWKYGFATVGMLNYNTACYTARYTFKKLKTDDSGLPWYEADELPGVFRDMSRRPAIGSFYYRDHFTDMFPGDEDYPATMCMLPNGHQTFYPAFFLRKLDHDDPDLSEKVKIWQSNLSRLKSDAIFSKVSYSEHEYLQLQESKLDSNLKKLLRSIE